MLMKTVIIYVMFVSALFAGTAATALLAPPSVLQQWQQSIADCPYCQ
jgi:hypothetical protein